MAGTKGITAITLKMIAVITMLIDHTAVAVLERGLVYYGADWPIGNRELWSAVYYVMRGIGRLAFPVYCYLLVEGFFYTRSVGKYILRLLMFGIISELPFDMALMYRSWNLYGGDSTLSHIAGLASSNNVYWTLMLGLLTIWGIETVRTKLWEMRGKAEEAQKTVAATLWSVLQIAGCFGILLAGGLAASWFRTDYGLGGVFAIAIFYVLRGRRMLAFTFAVLFLAYRSSAYEVAALLMLIPLYFYNGERGRSIKYFFYAFYPGHLLILAGVVWLLGMPIFF